MFARVAEPPLGRLRRFPGCVAGKHLQAAPAATLGQDGRRTNGSGHNSGLLPVVFAFFAARFSFSDLPGFFVLCFCGDLSGMSPLSSWRG
jgi:hypothetical protein